MAGKMKKTKRQQTPAKHLKRMDCRRRAVLKHNANAETQDKREAYNKETDDNGNLVHTKPWDEVMNKRFNSKDRVAKRRRYFKKLREEAGVN